MKKAGKNRSYRPFSLIKAKTFVQSIWLFPALLTVALVILTALRISGSSIGSYHSFFYGNTKPDSSLLLNNPQPIRSDEWLVNTQLTLAQKNNDFKRINENIGEGQDVSVLGEAPYKDWSTVFKLQNWAFFVLPFDNAFAFRWWFMAYLLILGCYFFVLCLLPGKKLLSTLLSLALFFSPFIHWWYLYGTLSVIYYALWGGLAFIKLLNESRLKRQLLWGALLAYAATSFVLVLYPPFQIPVALAMLAFVVGYLFEKVPTLPRRQVWRSLTVLAVALAVTGVITLIFIKTRSAVIKTIQNTAYPGKRIQLSGGYDAPHLLSGHLEAQLQSRPKAARYVIAEEGLTNQSENSNFVLLAPFLLLPALYLIYRHRKDCYKIPWALATVSLGFVGLVTWMLVPRLDFLGKLTLLQNVPHARLLIGLGVINLLMLTLFIRTYTALKSFKFKWQSALAYGLLIFVIELGLGRYAMIRTPGFISTFRVLMFSIPVPIAMYWLLRKRFTWAVGLLVLFGLSMTFRIQPLYRGTDVVSKTPLSTTIRRLSAADDGRWATENFLLENFAYMNGARSLTGVYSYPQLSLWRDADPSAPDDIYNRYAHTVFAFDRDPSVSIPTTISLGGGDSFGIHIEPCNKFFQKHSVSYVLTSMELSRQDSCATLVEQVIYPAQTFYIYKLNF